MVCSISSSSFFVVSFLPRISIHRNKNGFDSSFFLFFILSFFFLSLLSPISQDVGDFSMAIWWHGKQGKMRGKNPECISVDSTETMDLFVQSWADDLCHPVVSKLRKIVWFSSDFQWTKMPNKRNIVFFVFFSQKNDNFRLLVKTQIYFSTIKCVIWFWCNFLI